MEKVLESGLSNYFENSPSSFTGASIPAPEITANTGSYSEIILNFHLDYQERFVLILSMAPLLKPQALDILQIKNNAIGGEFTEFGRYRINNTGVFLPTFETACFILTGTDLDARIKFMKRFNKDHIYFSHNILEWDDESEISLHKKLRVTPYYEHFLLTGTELPPEYSPSFPAKLISTSLEWTDLVINEDTQEALKEIQDWVIHAELILDQWKMGKIIKTGYRALFYGPPGTGKTFAATLLGKYVSQPVYRIDLSAIVSKYIGETEKNLGKLFDTAAAKKWILFFDEADALFSKRTSTKGAHDKYANQEVAYLLQRIEDYDGLVILATNLQSNIDEAFSRRFQSIIYFPKPTIEERKILWQKILFDNLIVVEKNNFISDIAQYDLTGGQMINILRYCAIQAAKRGDQSATTTDILVGITREYNKENKTL